MPRPDAPSELLAYLKTPEVVARMTRAGQWPFKGYRVSVSEPVTLDLSGGMIEETDFDLMQFGSIRLANVELRDCNLSQLQVTAPDWRGVTLTACQVDGVRLRRGTLREVTVNGGAVADLVAVETTIERLMVKGADVSAIGLEESTIRDLSATDSQLSAVQLEECRIEELSCVGCTLTQVRASGGVFDTVLVQGGTVRQCEWSHVVVGSLTLRGTAIRSFRFGEGSIEACTIEDSPSVHDLVMIAQTIGRQTFTNVDVLVEPSLVGGLVGEVTFRNSTVYGARFTRTAAERGVRFEKCTVEGLDLTGASLSIVMQGGRLAGPQQVASVRLRGWTLTEHELDPSVKLVGTPTEMINVDPQLANRR